MGRSHCFCAKALGVCATVSVVSGVLIRRVPSYGRYLLKLFLFALLVRMVIGTCIFVFNGQDFFGGDAWTYDFFGAQQVLAWGGDKYAQINVDHFTGTGFASAWGMVYIVGVIYGVIGRNMLAIQFFNSVLGAATAPVIFLCAEEVFKNHRVAKVAGLAVAFYPSLVLWSSQGLKDGPIVFFLALCILATLKLGQKFSASYLLTLTFSLIGVVSFRFYVLHADCGYRRLVPNRYADVDRTEHRSSICRGVGYGIVVDVPGRSQIRQCSVRTIR